MSTAPWPDRKESSWCPHCSAYTRQHLIKGGCGKYLCQSCKKKVS